MERFKKIGQLFGQHYEKFLLSLVLLVLAFSVWFLFAKSKSEEEKIRRTPVGFERRTVKPVKPADMSKLESVLKLAPNPPVLNFSGPHNLFNPVKWQRKPDGSLLKIQTGNEVGPGAMSITNITPLHFIISFDKVVPSGGYLLSITREGAERPGDRKKKQRLAKLNEKGDTFILREIKGPPEDPTELVLELVDSGEKVSVFKDKPYMRPDGFEADLKYNVDGKTFLNQRVGGPLTFGGEDYIIVAINQNEVVMSARSTEKKFTIRQVAAR